MPYPLAVFAPEIGNRTETFIQRHIQDLLPGKTAVVCCTAAGAQSRDWAVKGPVFDLSPVHRKIVRGTVDRIARIPLLHRVRDLDPARRFLRRHNVQVMMGEYLGASLPWLNVAEKLGIRFFAHAHGYDVSARLTQPMWRTAYSRYKEASGVITMSQYSRVKLLELGLAPDKVHIVPYGVDVPTSVTVRTENETVQCVAVGRMVAKKGPLVTLAAFCRAAQSHPQLQLHFVGDGPLTPEVRQFIRDFDLEKNVTLHGSRPNVMAQQLMKESDIFLQHSMVDPETGDEEGLPVSILEAMAHGLPVVSTRHAGIAEAVVDGCTGHLVEEGDSDSMGEAIKALVQDPELRHRMGTAGWERARRLFTWEGERTALLSLLGLGDCSRIE